MKKQSFLLILLIFFLAAANWIWLTIDTQPPWWDQSDYLRTSLQYARSLKKLDFSNFLKDVTAFNRTRPPLVMILTTPIYIFNYRNEDLAVMMNILFLAITFLFIFKICKNYLNPRTAVLSCFLLAMYPAIYTHMTTYLVDIGLMCVVTASIYFLLKCDRFKRPGYSLLFGLSMGLGMLTKQSYPIFIAGPFLYIVWASGALSSINKNDEKTSFNLGKVRLNLLLCVIVASALTLSWYIPNFKEAVGLIFYNNSGEWATKFHPHYMSNLAYFLIFYIILMTYHGTSTIFAFLFVCSAIPFCFIKNDKFFHTKKIFIWWILLPFLVFTFAFNKQTRFLAPLLPAIAMITAYGIYAIQAWPARWIVVGFIVLLGLFQFIVDSFDVPITFNLVYKVPFKPLDWCDIVLFTARKTQRPVREEWMMMDALNAIKKDAKDTATVMLLSDHKAYNANTLNYYSTKYNLGLNFICAAWTDDVTRAMEEGDYKYVMYKSRNNDANIEVYQRKIIQAFYYVQQHPRQFKVIYERSLLDGSDLIIYKRI